LTPDPFSPERFVRFFEKVEPAPPPSGFERLGECWIWTGFTKADGYGVFHCPGFPAINGTAVTKNALAHRWATAFWYGMDTIHNLTHDHLCLRPACVNPRHGRAISRSENTARGNVTRWQPRLEDPFEALAL